LGKEYISLLKKLIQFSVIVPLKSKLDLNPGLMLHDCPIPNPSPRGRELIGTPLTGGEVR
jgi:hypothetical protein